MTTKPTIFHPKVGTVHPHEYDWRKQFAALDPGDGFVELDAGKVYGLAMALEKVRKLPEEWRFPVADNPAFQDGCDYCADELEAALKEPQP